MENIYELKKQRDQYYSLKDNLQIVVRYLNNTIDALSYSSQKMNEGYTIDGMAADRNHLSQYKEEIEEHRDKVLYSVIPGIDQELNNLRWKIQQAELELTDF